MDEHHWLDKHIEEQAAFYGRTPKKHAELMSNAAEFQEKIESGEEEEPIAKFPFPN